MPDRLWNGAGGEASGRWLPEFPSVLEDFPEAIDEALAGDGPPAPAYRPGPAGAGPSEPTEGPEPVVASAAPPPRVERRVSLRIPVPSGAMLVCWTDGRGIQRWAAVIDFSMRHLAFPAAGFDGEAVDAVLCPGPGWIFDVTRSGVERRDADRVVIRIEEFARGADDWMRWVEALTRIEEEG
ncbi:MAG: hypothetical protein Kow0092_40280 [Deferrisomatales bacterium]